MAGFILLKNGLWSPGSPNTLSVDAHPDPKDLRAAEYAHRDSAGERERLRTGSSAYVVIGDRLWFSYAPDAKVLSRRIARNPPQVCINPPVGASAGGEWWAHADRTCDKQRRRPADPETTPA